MKKTSISLNLLTITAISVLFFSCASVPKSSGLEVIEEASEKTVREPKPITVQNTSNQKETQFKNLLKRIEMKLVSAPSQKRTVYSGTAFKEPYVVSVADENGPVSDLDITISWPSARTNDTITYSTATAKTDENGKISFLPEPSAIAVKDKIVFYPTPVSSSASVIQAAYTAGVEAPFVVKSSFITYPGGILFVYNFNESGKPTTNNFELLQDLRNAGINAGNAPVSDTSYFNRPVKDLYNACNEIVGGAAKFMLIGSFKYSGSPVETENGTECTLTADITCLDMKDGSVLYKTSITDSAVDKTKWNAEKTCRAALAEKVADAIIYGM